MTQCQEGKTYVINIEKHFFVAQYSGKASKTIPKQFGVWYLTMKKKRIYKLKAIADLPRSVHPTNSPPGQNMQFSEKKRKSATWQTLKALLSMLNSMMVESNEDWGSLFGRAVRDSSDFGGHGSTTEVCKTAPEQIKNFWSTARYTYDAKVGLFGFNTHCWTAFQQKQLIFADTHSGEGWWYGLVLQSEWTMNFSVLCMSIC